jgi:superfamily I DNA/RNA helicase
MMTLELDAQQRAAAQAPLDVCVAIVGAAGTGKTTALQARIDRALATEPAAVPLILPARHRLDDRAFEILGSAGMQVRRVDDAEAALLFSDACAPLFALEWEEIASRQIDPDVPGLRSPERFAESAFRLIRKLRDAAIDPQEFLSRALTGATEFYAKPPNFAEPSLLAATKALYHDSLDVAPSDLHHQYRREVDLAKILAKLYEEYLRLLAAGGSMTGRDAIAAAADLLHADPARAQALRAHHRFGFVDEAEELTALDLRFLSALFGEELNGVTLCGDPSCAISPVRAAAPKAAFARAAIHVELAQQHRSPAVLDAACRRLEGTGGQPAASERGTLLLHRERRADDEAAFVAAQIERWLQAGTPPDRIAVLLRSAAAAEPFEAALLRKGIGAIVSGDVNVFADRRALDALALLWNVYDPFRHDWLLRTLSNPALGLSDASLALLCSEPPDPQTPLFVLDGEPAPTERASRFDPKRDLRLGWNVVRGEQDAALEPEARQRLQRFRRQREGWIELMHAAGFETFARAVWREGLAREGPPDSVQARAQQWVLERLLARLRAFGDENPDATVADVLAYGERRTRSTLESCEPVAGAQGCVHVASIDAMRGREFDYVAIPGAAAGSFPRWYAPDAFLFSPRLGMVPRENAGESRASRTAKFSYYLWRSKAREGYNAHERRAFAYALRRARRGALVTASGGVTRGTTAPEFLEELRAARLEGAEQL